MAPDLIAQLATLAARPWGLIWTLVVGAVVLAVLGLVLLRRT